MNSAARSASNLAASFLRAGGYVLLVPSLFYAIIFIYYEGFAENLRGIGLVVLGGAMVLSGNFLKKYIEGDAIRVAIKQDLKKDE